MVNKTIYQLIVSNLGVKIFLKNREHQKKGALKEKIEASFCTLCIGVSRKFHFAKILQNGANFMQICTPGFKNHMRNLDNIRKAVKCPKS